MLDRDLKILQGEALYFAGLKNPHGVMSKAQRRGAIQASEIPDFLKKVIEVEPDKELKELAQKRLKELGGFRNFIFDD